MSFRGPQALRMHERLAYLGALGFGVIGALLYAAPLRFGGVDIPAPWLPLIPVYFWALLRPDLARAASAFAIGLFQDFVSGGPLGVWALTYLIAFAVLAPQREAFSGQTGGAVWIGFSLFVVIAAVTAFAAGWLGTRFHSAPNLEGLGLDPSVLGERDIRPGPAVVPLISEAFVTMLIGPLAARALGGFSRIGSMERPA
jgi:rod shape-determining protein MreD